MILPDTDSREPQYRTIQLEIFLFWKYCQLQVTTYTFGSLHASWCQLGCTSHITVHWSTNSL